MSPKSISPTIPTTGAGIHKLPFDVFPSIFSALAGGTHDLSRCSLVNRLFYDTATPYLYRKIHLKTEADHRCHRWNMPGVLRTLKAHKSLRRHVRFVDHRCFFTSDFRTRERFDWEELISDFINIVSYTLHLEGSYLPPLFLRLVTHPLSRCPKLSEFNLYSGVFSCHTTELHVLPNIRNLRLGRPTKEGLLTLPSFKGMKSLGIGNSVFVSMSMLPTLRITLAGLTRFDLGAGHNLSYEELCTILHEAPFLKLLDIYWPRTTLSDSKKMLYPDRFSGLPFLDQLILRYEGEVTPEMDAFYQCLYVLLEPASLTAFSLISEERTNIRDSERLLSLMTRHPQLRMLDIPWVHLRERDLSLVLHKLPQLEVISFFVSEGTSLSGFPYALCANTKIVCAYIRSRLDCELHLGCLERRGRETRQRSGLWRLIGRTATEFQAIWTLSQNSHRVGLDPLSDEGYTSVVSETFW